MTDDLRLRRRQLLGLVAAGLLPAACGWNAETGRQPVGHTTTRSGAPGPVPSASGAAPLQLTYPWVGKGPVPATPGRTMLGAYLGLSGRSLSAALKLRRQQLRRDQRIVHSFYAWRDDLPRAFPELPPGAIPMVSWRGTRYTDVNDGSSDRLIERAAKGFKTYGRPVLLRWAWEMNGDWYAWGGPKNGNDLKGFASAWKRLWHIFRDTGASQVSFVWAPNWNSRPGTPANDLVNYYPGDRYVDWVGVSGYPLNEQSPETLYGPLYRQFSPRKPIMLAETAGIDHGGSSKADWTVALRSWVEQHPAVCAMVWFDTDTHPFSAENFRIDSSPDVLNAYRALASAARFAG
jgi:Glycosyl hydrolase family 26